MSAYARLVQLVDYINTQLPENYVLGYELHDDADTANLTRGDAWSKGRWRAFLGARADAGDANAATDLAAIPADGTDEATAGVLFEMLHVPTLTRVVRVVSFATLRDIATNDTLTTAQKRTAVRNAVISLLNDCQARVPA